MTTPALPERCPTPGCGAWWVYKPKGTWTCEQGHEWPVKSLQAPAVIPRAPEDRSNGHHQAGGILWRTIALADVTPELVKWVWRSHVPIGKVSILDGDPGLGKSTLTLDLAARVSTGAAMPDGSVSDLARPSGVIILSAEDGLADTIAPRLLAAGADLTRIRALTEVFGVRIGDDGNETRTPRPPTLADLEAIEGAILEVDARLVILDPLMAFLPDEVNANRDQQIRRALAPLVALIEHLGVALIVVRHLNKSAGGNPLYRGGASIGIIAAARAGLLVAADPDDTTGHRRILACTKSNLAEKPPALAYHLEQVAEGAVRVAWDGPTSHTAAQLLAVPEDTETRSAMDEATDFLRDLLADSPLPAKDVMKEARAAAIAERTLDRAKRAAGVVTRRDGFGPGATYLWSLPIDNTTIERQKTAIEAIDCQSPGMASYGDVGALWTEQAAQPPADAAEDRPAADRDRRSLDEWAFEHRWPALTYKPGHSIVADPDAWHTWLRSATPDDLRLAAQAARDYAQAVEAQL